jgi:hypothetical protein
VSRLLGRRDPAAAQSLSSLHKNETNKQTSVCVERGNDVLNLAACLSVSGVISFIIFIVGLYNIYVIFISHSLIDSFASFVRFHNKEQSVFMSRFGSLHFMEIYGSSVFM